MSVPKPARNISLPASLVENLVRIQAEELERLKKRLDEAQLGNTSITSELSALVESTAKVIADLDEALTQSQEKIDSIPSTPKSVKSRSRRSTSVISLASTSEAFTDANFSSVAANSQVSSMFDVGRMDDFVDGPSSKEQSGETTLMELLATKPLNPFSYKPWPQQYIKALRQQGILRQPCFYPGDELIINFADRRQAHLITVMYTTNNAQRSKKLHAYYEEFGLKGWCGALIVRHEQAWYYAGTYRTTGYVKIGGGEFISLPEETKHPVYVQATHAIQVPKMRASSSVKSKKDSDKSGSKKSIGAASAAVPSKQEVQTQILDGRVELARIVFNLVSWEEDIQKSLEKLSF